MKRLIIASTLTLSLFIAGCSGWNAEPDLEGIYRITGVTVNGQTYTGATEIRKDPRHEGVYFLRWMSDRQPNRIMSEGVGYIHKDTSVFVVIIKSNNRFLFGSYLIVGDQLVGNLIVPTVTGLFDETMRKTGEETLQDALQPVLPPNNPPSREVPSNPEPGLKL
jgi:hypothetical protein